MTQGYEHYYVPTQSKWPFIGACGLFLFVIGAANWFHAKPYGPYIFLAGISTLIFMLCGWFQHVIEESQHGLYSHQMDLSFRWGMFWFIFSEVMFFAGFFGALFYVRELAVPWLGGLGAKPATKAILWTTFNAEWPLLHNPNPTMFANPLQDMGWKWLPSINTFILLLSSVTVTWAHHALIANHRKILILGLSLTVLLGISFISLQAYEYHHAYHTLKLTLASGIYGTTFYVLTGFHGAHVTIGTIMLTTMLVRCIKGHFTPQHHFGFEATAWYWHFVDVVWLFLFLFVYVLPLRG